ncbi:DUF393 domain-containing protein [Candidatus Peribacteria bacterium]|nr:DUF393 domain-containing protein [Candidatus Peribacteria bacterium]
MQRSFLWQTVLQYLTRPFRLSSAGLLILRVGVGLLLVLDCLRRLPYAEAWLSDTGVLPRDAMVQLTGGLWSWSVFSVSGGTWWAVALLLAGVVTGALMAVGYRTRLMSVLAFVLINSLDVRNPLLSSGADLLLRLASTWAMLLPLGRVSSLDLAFGHTRPLPESVHTTGFLSAASVGLVLQVALIYLSTVLYKDAAVWRESFLAVYYALGLRSFVLPLGEWIFPYLWLTKLLTVFTLLLELIAPLLLLTPWRRTRTLGIGLLLLLHLGFGLTLQVGMFPLIGSVVALSLLPPGVWESLRQWWHARRNRPYLLVYTDTQCGLCARWAAILQQIGALGRVAFLPLSEAPMELQTLSQSRDSWVADTPDHLHPTTRTAALGRILRRSWLWWPVGGLLLLAPLRWLGDTLYVFLSARRHGVCALPLSGLSPEPRPGYSRWLQGLWQGFVLLNVGFLCYWVVLGTTSITPPSWATTYANAARWTQNWNMFSPPPTGYGWYVIEGRLNNGALVDVWKAYAGYADPRVVRYTVPEDVRATTISPRWQKYLENIASSDHTAFRPSFNRYLCRWWNATHPEHKDQLQSLTVTYMEQLLLENYVRKAPQRIDLSQHQCGVAAQPS